MKLTLIAVCTTINDYCYSNIKYLKTKFLINLPSFHIFLLFIYLILRMLRFTGRIFGIENQNAFSYRCSEFNIRVTENNDLLYAVKF